MPADWILVSVYSVHGDDMPDIARGRSPSQARHVLASGSWSGTGARAVTSWVIAGGPVRAWLAPPNAEAEHDP